MSDSVCLYQCFCADPQVSNYVTVLVWAMRPLKCWPGIEQLTAPQITEIATRAFGPWATCDLRPIVVH